MVVAEQVMVKIITDSPVIMPHGLALVIKLQETEHLEIRQHGHSFDTDLI